MNRSLALLVSLCALLFSAEAVAETGDATRFVQSNASTILAIVNSAAADADAVAVKRSELRESIRGFLSFEVLAERTLGREEWERRSESERTEFVALLRELIETSYSRRLGRRSVEPSSYDVVYRGERVRADRATVEAEVEVDGTRHFIEVKMLRTGDTWQVYDLVTDDVSLEESYAESFESIIARDGWDGLLTRMRNRLERLRSE